jgi:hypothetical protein
MTTRADVCMKTVLLKALNPTNLRAGLRSGTNGEYDEIG